jgi:hypothetical protein
MIREVRTGTGMHVHIGFSNDSYRRNTSWEIVGVAGDTRQQRLETAPTPQLFLPMGQFPPDGFTYLLRTGLSPNVRRRPRLSR